MDGQESQADEQCQPYVWIGVSGIIDQEYFISIVYGECRLIRHLSQTLLGAVGSFLKSVSNSTWRSRYFLKSWLTDFKKLPNAPSRV